MHWHFLFTTPRIVLKGADGREYIMLKAEEVRYLERADVSLLKKIDNHWCVDKKEFH